MISKEAFQDAPYGAANFEKATWKDNSLSPQLNGEFLKRHNQYYVNNKKLTRT
jgi:hypothetical protein